MSKPDYGRSPGSAISRSRRRSTQPFESSAHVERWLAHPLLAALAIEHGAALCSADSDFARFPGLEWANPLAE